MRTDRAVRRRSLKRGFSLIELLVVLVVLGITATVAGVATIRILRRNALSSAAQTIQAMASRAYLEAQRRSAVMFLRIAPPVPWALGSESFIPIELWVDANGNGTFDNADTVIETYRLLLLDKGGSDAQVVSLSTVNKSQIQTANWSNNATDTATERLLACDTFGRTINPATAQQIAAPATLSFTLPEMASGSLLPLRGYQLRISPAWTVQIVEIRP